MLIPDLNELLEEIPDATEEMPIEKISNETLCSTIASCIYLRYNETLQVDCMLELARRRNAGDDFQYEDEIDRLTKEFSPINYSNNDINLSSLILKGNLR